MFWGTCFVLNFGATMYSLNLYINTAKYMFLGKDTKYKAGQVQGDTGAIDESDARVEDRTIIFIRHGESTWNQTFNPGASAPSAHRAIVCVAALDGACWQRESRTSCCSRWGCSTR